MARTGLQCLAVGLECVAIQHPDPTMSKTHHSDPTMSKTHGRLITDEGTYHTTTDGESHTITTPNGIGFDFTSWRGSHSMVETTDGGPITLGNHSHELQEHFKSLLWFHATGNVPPYDRNSEKNGRLITDVSQNHD